MSFGAEGHEMMTVYERELPGGGFVHVRREGSPHLPGPYRALVLVERRTDPTRRDGHEPPIIASVEGSDPESPAVGELVRLAQDNVAIAKALLRLRGDGRAQF